VIGSTPALVNPTLAVGTPTGGGINAVQVMALERELQGAQDGKHNRAPPKVSSRSVHGNLLFPLHLSIAHGVETVDEHTSSNGRGVTQPSRAPSLCQVGALQIQNNLFSI